MISELLVLLQPHRFHPDFAGFASYVDVSNRYSRASSRAANVQFLCR